MYIFSLLLVSLIFLGCDDSSASLTPISDNSKTDFNITLSEKDSKSLAKAFTLNTKVHLDIIEYIKKLRNAYSNNETTYICKDGGVMEFTFGADSVFPATIHYRLCNDGIRFINGKISVDENATAYTVIFRGDNNIDDNFFYLNAPLQLVEIEDGSTIIRTKATNDLTYEHWFFKSDINYMWQEMNVSFSDYKHTLMDGESMYNYHHESGMVTIDDNITFEAVSGVHSANCGSDCDSVNLVQLFIIDSNIDHGSVSFKEVESSQQINIIGNEVDDMLEVSGLLDNYDLNISKYMYLPSSITEFNEYEPIIWKEHKIDGLSSSENEALNKTLEEIGITSEQEIYEIKSKMEATMITYKSLGLDTSNYIENHIRSLEYSQNMGELSDTNKKVLEVLYAIEETE